MNETEYLLVPHQYAGRLGGMVWSNECDAVVDADGNTIAVSSALAQFIEGAGSRERLVHFGFVLHFLHRLLRPAEAPNKLRALSDAWRGTSGSMRNAGVLFAELVRALPRVSSDLDVREVCRLLRRPSELVELHFITRSPVTPPVSPKAFDEHLERVLATLSADDLRHWLIHGRGAHVPDAGHIELPPPPTRTLGGALEEALKRKRLAGVAPFVDQMVSALSLPPRRVQYTELPVGGYSSVTNRGHPDQILFSEFAVPELEFLRRYAENELLYYQREEPQSQVREDSVVLLDQGVRTWGETRLMLSAAAVALGRRADRRGTPVKFASTGNHGEPLDPLEDDVARLLESSDLSPNPGLALERVLEEPMHEARDVILLTHPRNLHEADVAIAARRAGDGLRLFALGVDEEGRAELAEFRRGGLVTLRRFQLSAPAKREDTTERAEPAEPLTPWKGPVESVPFPFRFGLIGGVRHLAMERDGSAMFTVSDSMIRAWRTDGDSFEVLPRPYVDDWLLREPMGAVGVTGGLVLCYRVERGLIVAHYDLVTRRLRIHRDPSETGWTSVSLDYLPEFHSVVLRKWSGPVVFARVCIDLDTGESAPPATGDKRVVEARQVADSFEGQAIPPRVQQIDQPPEDIPLTGANSGATINLDGARSGPGVKLLHKAGTGKLALMTPRQIWRTWQPLSDGGALLKDAHVMESVHAGGTLAMRVARDDHEHVLIFRGPEWDFVGRFNSQSGMKGLAISDDGAYVAYRNRTTNVVGFHIGDEVARRFAAAPGKVHTDLVLELGECWCTVYGGKFTHLLRWDREKLEIAFLQGRQDVQEFIRRKRDAASLNPRSVRARHGQTRVSQYDYDRFRQYGYSPQGLLFVTDRYGQVAVFDAGEKLAAMFYVNRGTVAVWTPGGSRYGPAGITGGATTPDALGKIGAALRKAEG